MPIDTRLLSRAMKVFANAEPREYEKFVAALEAYVQEVTVAVTEAETDGILVAKGRAQQARKLLQLFKDLPQE